MEVTARDTPNTAEGRSPSGHDGCHRKRQMSCRVTRSGECHALAMHLAVLSSLSIRRWSPAPERRDCHFKLCLLHCPSLPHKMEAISP